VQVKDIGVKHDLNAYYACQKDAVFQSEAEKLRLFFNAEAGSGGGHGYSLQTDHFAHHTTCGIRGGDERGAEAQAAGGNYLETSEESVR
jgi:hypothetical protein